LVVGLEIGAGIDEEAGVGVTTGITPLKVEKDEA
jgi:hypothetical protein